MAKPRLGALEATYQATADKYQWAAAEFKVRINQPEIRALMAQALRGDMARCPDLQARRTTLLHPACMRMRVRGR